MTLTELERLLEQRAAVVFGATQESVDAAERRLLAACHDLHGGSLRAEELFKRVIRNCRSVAVELGLAEALEAADRGARKATNGSDD
jgi:hypothetical protein